MWCSGAVRISSALFIRNTVSWRRASCLALVGSRAARFFSKGLKSHFQAKRGTRVPAGASVPHQEGQRSSQLYQHQRRLYPPLFVSAALCSSAQAHRSYRSLQVSLFNRSQIHFYFGRQCFAPWFCHLDSCPVNLGATACGYHGPAGACR